MSEFLIQPDVPIQIKRNNDPAVWCSYCKERFGMVFDKDIKKTIWHPKAQQMAYWVIRSIHPERKQEYTDKTGQKYTAGIARAYCLDCVNDIEMDGFSLQEQLAFGATYTHKLSTGCENEL
jgi:hypothetical protein